MQKLNCNVDQMMKELAADLIRHDVNTGVSRVLFDVHQRYSDEMNLPTAFITGCAIVELFEKGMSFLAALRGMSDKGFEASNIIREMMIKEFADVAKLDAATAEGLKFAKEKVAAGVKAPDTFEELLNMRDPSEK